MRKLTPAEMRALLEQTADAETAAVLWDLAVENGHTVAPLRLRPLGTQRSDLLGFNPDRSELVARFRVDTADAAEVELLIQQPVYLVPAGWMRHLRDHHSVSLSR